MTTTSVGDPLVGHVLDGRYELVERLARGGMATVYKAVDTRLTRTVAVKVMHVGLGDDAEFGRKFDREARAAARLSHPCVVSVFDQGQDEGRPFIVMEYVPGQTLRDLIAREAPLPPLRALELIEPMLSALATAHEAGLVHRDVKPENVLISERGQLKVADFGLAKAITSQTSTATQGLLIGTVSYLPPELVTSGRADARSDVYSAGIVLFELLTGKKPHTGETPIQVAYAHVHKDVPPPSTMRTAGPIPPYLDALIAHATARDPDHRPHDARVLLMQVRRVRSAVRDGLSDDPELTQDLSVLLPTPSTEPQIEPTPTHLDVEDLAVAALTDPNHWLREPAPALVRPQPALDPQQSAQRRRRNRVRRRAAIALVLAVALIAAMATAGWYVFAGRYSSTPALAGLTRDAAAAAAAQAGLDVSFETTFSETVPLGEVVDTDPTAGSRIVSGGELTAYLSKGPERYAVPAVSGMTQQQATDALVAAHLVLGSVTTAFSDSVEIGRVIESSHAAGQSLKPQTPVDLTVSKGPPPIKITDYTGKNADKAVAALKKAGFDVTAASKHSGSVAKGLVIRQSPHEGAGVKGDEIEIISSLGPVMVTVPNVRRMGVKAAQDVMADAGFKTIVRPAAVNYLGLGFVVTSSPAARTKAPKGSTITLYVI